MSYRLQWDVHQRTTPHPEWPSCSSFPVVRSDLTEVNGKLPRSHERRDIVWLCGYLPACLGGFLGRVSLLTEYSGPCTVLCVVLLLMTSFLSSSLFQNKYSIVLNAGKFPAVASGHFRWGRMGGWSLLASDQVRFGSDTHSEEEVRWGWAVTPSLCWLATSSLGSRYSTGKRDP